MTSMELFVLGSLLAVMIGFGMAVLSILYPAFAYLEPYIGPVAAFAFISPLIFITVKGCLSRIMSIRRKDK